MRTRLLSLLAIFTLPLFTSAQSTLLPSGVDIENVTWVDGDVLIRFEDHISIDFDKYHKTGIASIDAILQDLDIREVEQLFPYEIEIPSREEGFYTYNGLYVEYPRLDNIYRINFKDSLGANLFHIIDRLSAQNEYVKYAEPNYYSGIMGVTPANEPNDTLYSQQWANEAIQADTVQARMAADTTVSDTNQVIAIIDTGVDKDHEDLKNKMWVNLTELNGSPGVDDDGNGFIDDTYGWDFINNDGNPMDDNSHGTHCAGSAAAEVNNSKGIAGVSPGAKIMAVKVMQSSGYGSASDISQGILYAANNGASVISMSIGGPAQSQVQKDALAVAYAYSFLVGAAGNNGKCIGIPSPLYVCPDGQRPIQIYPGAFSYVLGVEASAPSGGKAGFSNWDQDGPIGSAWPDLLNYEVRAPGAQIISAKPAGNTGNNGLYKFSQGTSMATPAVAGAVSLLKSFKPTFTHEKVFLHLIKTQANNIQLNTAIDYILPTEITYVTTSVVDTLDGDQDNRPDAGETIELVMKVKNTGGYNDSVWASIELDPLEDPTLVDFIDSVRFFGSVSEYATIENNLPDSAIYPFKIKLDSNIANARDIKFVVKLWTGDSTFVDSSSFILHIQNGIEFGAAYYPGTTIMYPNKYYLISGNTVFDSLIIKPGTEVYLETGVTIGSDYIYAVGSPDSLIHFSGVRGQSWRNIKILNPFSSLNFSNGSVSSSGSMSIAKYCLIENAQPQFLEAILTNFFEISNNVYRNCRVSNYDVMSAFGLSSVQTSSDSLISFYLTSNSVNGNGRISYTTPRLFQNVYMECRFWDGYNNKGIRSRFYGASTFWSTTGFTGTNLAGILYGDSVIINNSMELLDLSGKQQKELIPIIGSNLFFNNTNVAGSNGKLRLNVYENYYDVVSNNSINSSTADLSRALGVKMQEDGSINIVKPINLNLGGNSSAYLSLVEDYFEDSKLDILDYSGLVLDKMEKAHGYVVDIRIDGKSTHWIDNPYNTTTGTGIIGNGTYKFTVEFNREMDTTVTPLLTFGIREPWTQNIVSDSSYWSADGKEFNAYVTIDPLTQSDGINRISVRLAEDNEHFPCPTENVRFECRISSTGSLSAGFAAVGDTGKIHLDWGIPDEEIDDYLGTNMYRIDSTDLTNPTYIYSQMQVDSMMTDTTVQAGQWYGYYYKIVRTSLTELNESDTVWARPWQGKPSVETRGVTNKTHNSATINGKANPNYLSTDVRFNYGISSNYTTNTSWQSIGNGDNSVSKSVSLSGLTPGTTYHYRIEAKNVEGTSYGEDSTFTTKDFPNLAYSYDSTLCIGDDVSFTNQSTISNGTLSYDWEIRNSNGSLVHSSTVINPTFTMSTAGTYTVKLTASSSDAVTTTKSTGLIVEATPTPSITAGGATSFCQGGTVTLSGNTGYQSYLWSNGSTTSTVTVSDSNTYILTVTSANGCIGTTSINVDVNPLPTATVSSATGSFDFCDGTTLELTAPAGASGYQWYDGSSPITGATSASYSAAATGNYSVEVTSADGCASLSTAQAVTKNVLPSAAISNASSLAFCEGDSVVLTAPAGLSYAWTTGATTQSITATASGQVGLTVTDANGCSATSTSVQVTTYNIPTLSIAAPAGTSICAGESTTLTASAGFASYAWGSGSTSISKIVTTSGTYTVTGTTSDGCITTASETVTVNAAPTATITNSGSSVLCSGDSTTLSAPSGMSAYLWSNGATTQDITTATGGSYTVTVTNADGCSATSAATTINTSQITAPTVGSNGPLEFCDGGSVTLAVPLGYNSVNWNNGSSYSQITATTSGDYFAMVSNQDGCMTTSDTITVVVNPLPATPTITYTMSDTIMISSAPQGNQWYFNGAQLSGATDDTLRPYNFGNYSVMVEDANGCASGMSAMQFYNSIGVEEDLASMIGLYPNPTTGQVMLELGAIETERIVLQDALGLTLMVKEAPGAQVQIDLENEASGMYFIRVYTKTGEVLSLNVAKQ
jgi:subtilisin family serine protease